MTGSTGAVTGVDLFGATEDGRAPVEVCEAPLVDLLWMLCLDKLTFDGPTDFLMATFEVDILEVLLFNVVFVIGVIVLFTILE